MKRSIRLSLLIFCCLNIVISLFIHINVNANSDSFSNGLATYKVTDVAVEYDLGFGVKYHQDVATTSVTDSRYARGDGANNEVKYDVEANKEYTQQVNVLEIASTKDVQLVPYAYLAKYSWSSSTLRTAAMMYEMRNPGYKVIAGVNGDYFQIKQPVPASTGVTIGQGEFYKSMNDHGGANTIAIKNNGEGKQLFTTTATQNAPVLSIYDNEGNVIKKFNIDKVNEKPENDEISLYYAYVTKSFQNTFLPGPEVSEGWLVGSAQYAVTTRSESFYGLGEITEKILNDTIISEGEFAIETSNEEVNQLLKVGAKIRVQYEFTDESLQGIENFIGFPFTILENNEVKNHDAYRHPRTMIGQKENGEIILAVIDGRQENSKGFYGASSAEMAALMGYYGCVDAWNLDGGGSSTLIIRKQPGLDFEGYNEQSTSNYHVTNSPSDKSERNDGNHLLVVVKVPEINFNIEEIAETSISFNVVLLSELEKYKNLYVYCNGEYYEVEDGKVTISGLEKGNKYDFYVYAGIDDEMYNLMYNISCSTNKAVPSLVSIDIDVYFKGSNSKIRIVYNVNDPEAVRSYVFIADDDYLSVSDEFTVEKHQEFYDSLKDAKIKIKYLINDIYKEETIVLEDFEINFSIGYIMDEQFESFDNFIDDIFN